MTTNNANIFLGSVIVYSNKATLWGDMNVCPIPFLKFKFLSDSLDYALLQYEKDPDNYELVVKKLRAKIDILRYECKDICTYKLQLS